MIYSTRPIIVGVLRRSEYRDGVLNARLSPLALCHEARDPAIHVNTNRFMHLSSPLARNLSDSRKENEPAIANRMQLILIRSVKHNRRKIGLWHGIMEKLCRAFWRTRHARVIWRHGDKWRLPHVDKRQRLFLMQVLARDFWTDL